MNFHSPLTILPERDTHAPYASTINGVVISVSHVISPVVRIAHSVCSGPKRETDSPSFFFSPGSVFPISLGAFFCCSSTLLASFLIAKPSHSSSHYAKLIDRSQETAQRRRLYNIVLLLLPLLPERLPVVVHILLRAKVTNRWQGQVQAQRPLGNGETASAVVRRKIQAIFLAFLSSSVN